MLTSCFSFFQKDFINSFREGMGGRKGGGETLICERNIDPFVGCLSHAPNRGAGPQPRHVPRLGIKPVAFQSAGGCPMHPATPVRAIFLFIVSLFLKDFKMLIDVLYNCMKP